ncbi:MAG: putative RNA uridine N3 methyltransferase [Nitrososphaerales archaeon]
MPDAPLLSIAIPDSLFSDEESLRGKTVKAGQIARAASIFAVERIYIYRDASSNYDKDYLLAKQLLEYAETPQYLRKRLIGKNADLEFAGLLPPLKIPHHMKLPKPVPGELREAVLFMQNGKLQADVGAREFAIYEGRGQPNERITTKVLSTQPLKVTQSQRPSDIYWGYEVRRAPSLSRFLQSSNFELLVLTSRKGENVSDKWHELCARSQSEKRILLCFGSPQMGVDQMLRQDHSDVTHFKKAMYLNMIPCQQVATVRLEEAVIICLGLTNLAIRV